MMNPFKDQPLLPVFTVCATAAREELKLPGDSPGDILDNESKISSDTWEIHEDLLALISDGRSVEFSSVSLLIPLSNIDYGL
jgi:hypothetical protein